MKMKFIKLVAVCLVVVAAGMQNEVAIGQSSSKGSSSKSQGSMMKPVEMSNGVAELGPHNSKIEFIGTHVGDDPKPRLGGFKKFKGQIKLGADNSVESLTLDIDVKSVWTQFDDLTKHLKNADFFETTKFPTARFVSTKVVTDQQGMQITGNLTLHGSTQEITIPVKGKLDSSGLMMVSEFQLDRTRFGMDKMTSGVEKRVSLKFVVGEKTRSTASRSGPGTEPAGSDQGSSNSHAEPTLITLFAPNMT